MRPELSFIVPAHNEAQGIALTLEGLHEAGRRTGRPYEIVVVDDASTDATAAIARSAGATVVSAHVRHIAATRNIGARAAVGATLMFVDADTWVPAETVSAALAALQAGAVGGGARVRFDGPVPLVAVPSVVFVLGAFRLTNMTVGCFMFCTREAFERIGGFDERLFAAEEVAFSLAVKRVGRLVLVKPAVVTSARKFRTHSTWELVRMSARALVGRALRSRDVLPLWYGERRYDPGAMTTPDARPAFTNARHPRERGL